MKTVWRRPPGSFCAWNYVTWSSWSLISLPQNGSTAYTWHGELELSTVFWSWVRATNGEGLSQATDRDDGMSGITLNFPAWWTGAYWYADMCSAVILTSGYNKFLSMRVMISICRASTSLFIFTTLRLHDGGLLGFGVLNLPKCMKRFASCFVCFLLSLFCMCVVCALTTFYYTCY